jgi:hypothetical protein
VTDYDLPEPDDDLPVRKDDVAGQATEENLQERIALRRALAQQRQEKESVKPERHHYDPATIARNLQALMRSKGLSIQDTVRAMSETGEYQPKEYRWLKRVATVGIAQTDNRTSARLEKLAEFFGVTAEFLRRGSAETALWWEEFEQYDSVNFRRYGCRLRFVVMQPEFQFVKALLECLHQEIADQFPAEDTSCSLRPPDERPHPYVRMLFRLLATGKHEYLKELITELYGRITRDLAAEYENNNGRDHVVSENDG